MTLRTKVEELRELELIRSFFKEVLQLNDPDINTALSDLVCKMYIFAYLSPGGGEYQFQFLELNRSALRVIELLSGSDVVIPDLLLLVANAKRPARELTQFMSKNKRQFQIIAETAIPGFLL